MLKILGRASSINVQKVMWLIAELGLEVERVDIGGPFGGNDQPDYLAKNPMGRVPTLEDGDLVIFESHSIVRHIAETHGADPWYPADRRHPHHDPAIAFFGHLCVAGGHHPPTLSSCLCRTGDGLAGQARC